jgi:probable HAF family extracellular repeat protein
MKQRILIALVVFLVPIASAQVYKVTDLGPLSPTAINTWGQVVGNLNGQAYIWTQFAGLRGLGTLTGGTYSYATSINDLGVVTGNADGPFTIISPYPELDYGPNQYCSDLTQPFVWTPGKGMHGLGTLGPYNFYGEPDWCETGYYGTGVDPFGQVVGYTSGYSTYQFGFLWTSAAGMTMFGGSWPPTFINEISNTGQIVGQNASLPNPAGISTIFLGHATSWKNGVATDLGTLGGAADLGWPFGYSSSADGVNDLGQIVGWSTTTPMESAGLFGWTGSVPIHAILWPTTGGLRDLGTLSGDEFSAASKINLFGQAIGISGNVVAQPNSSYPQFDPRYEVVGRPFIWSKRSGMQDLNTLIRANSGWVLSSATGINIWGQIVGTGVISGQTHGFLLTPKAF